MKGGVGLRNFYGVKTADCEGVLSDENFSNRQFLNSLNSIYAKKNQKVKPEKAT